MALSPALPKIKRVVTGAVSQSCLVIFGACDRYFGVDAAWDMKTTKKAELQFGARLLLPANLINDHLRLQIGFRQLLNGQTVLFKFAPCS